MLIFIRMFVENFGGKQMKNNDKITYMQTKETYDFATGEMTSEERITSIKLATEPNYIKLYIDCLLTFKELSKSLNPILLEFLKYMSYASTADNFGGQVIYVNAQMKRNIASSQKVTVKRVDQAITHFVKANIFKRIATATYQVNPNMFGRGEWKDIKNIKANFDFNTGDIEAEIIKDNSPLKAIK